MTTIIQNNAVQSHEIGEVPPLFCEKEEKNEKIEKVYQRFPL